MTSDASGENREMLIAAAASVMTAVARFGGSIGIIASNDNHCCFERIEV